MGFAEGNTVVNKRRADPGREVLGDLGSPLLAGAAATGGGLGSAGVSRGRTEQQTVFLRGLVGGREQAGRGQSGQGARGPGQCLRHEIGCVHQKSVLSTVPSLLSPPRQRPRHTPPQPAQAHPSALRRTTSSSQHPSRSAHPTTAPRSRCYLASSFCCTFCLYLSRPAVSLSTTFLDLCLSDPPIPWLLPQDNRNPPGRASPKRLLGLFTLSCPAATTVLLMRPHFLLCKQTALRVDRCSGVAYLFPCNGQRSPTRGHPATARRRKLPSSRSFQWRPKARSTPRSRLATTFWSDGTRFLLPCCYPLPAKRL